MLFYLLDIRDTEAASFNDNEYKFYYYFILWTYYLNFYLWLDLVQVKNTENYQIERLTKNKKNENVTKYLNNRWVNSCQPTHLIKYS